LPELPAEWAYTLLDPILSIERAGMKTGPFGSLLKKEEHKTEGISVLGIENIDYMKFLKGSKIHISEEKASQLSDYDARPDDIIISRSGTVGEVCVVPEDIDRAIISTNLMRVTLNPSALLPKFFCLLLNGSPFVTSQISELCKGSTRAFLNQEILSSIIFPLAPFDEQRLIVDEVERYQSYTEQLENDLGNDLVKANRLRQSILKRAFEGRLVPQDPGEEPASVLLERINDERTKESPRRGRRSNTHQTSLIQ
jgi:type I restriction enzyme S subunit